MNTAFKGVGGTDTLGMNCTNVNGVHGGGGRMVTLGIFCIHVQGVHGRVDRHTSNKLYKL